MTRDDGLLSMSFAKSKQKSSSNVFGFSAQRDENRAGLAGAWPFLWPWAHFCACSHRAQILPLQPTGPLPTSPLSRWHQTSAFAVAWDYLFRELRWLVLVRREADACGQERLAGPQPCTARTRHIPGGVGGEHGAMGQPDL